MGISTISMAIFHSYFDITGGSSNIKSHKKNIEKPPFSYGFPMVFRFSYGFPMLFLCFSYAFPYHRGDSGHLLLTSGSSSKSCCSVNSSSDLLRMRSTQTSGNGPRVAGGWGDGNGTIKQ